MTKEETLKALLATDLTDAQWTKSSFSGSTGQDCLEATRVDGLGWVLRHSILNDQMIPLTDSEYAAFCAGVKAGEPGLVP